MFRLKQNISGLSRTNLTLLSIICLILFLLVVRISFAALTLSSTTVTSDGALNSVSTGNFNFTTTTANADTLRLTPATGGAATFAGIITSADLSADRTWTLPNSSGTIALTGAGVAASDITSGTFSFALRSSATPGFLAYNSVTDNSITNNSDIDFDTEVYDTLGNFASDTFTAPVTGTYHLCATVRASTIGSIGFSIVTSNRSYKITTDASGLGSGSLSQCVYADMDAADTAKITQSSGEDNDIIGGGSPYVTFFSGRLMP